MDAGFTSLENYIRNPVFRKQSGHDQQSREWNKAFSSYRTVVENVFSHIKKWGACSQRWRGPTDDYEYHNMVWVVAGALVNMFVHPIRQPA